MSLTNSAFPGAPVVRYSAYPVDAVVAENSTPPLYGVYSHGVDAAAPGLISATMYVPPTVPSLRHNSAPNPVPSSAGMYSAPLITLQNELLAIVSPDLIVVNPVPGVVLSVLRTE